MDHASLDDKNMSATVMDLLYIVIKAICLPLHRTGTAGGRDGEQTLRYALARACSEFSRSWSVSG